MTDPKWKMVIAMKEKFYDADQSALASLCHCDIRTVERALKRDEAKHLLITPESAAVECEDDVELLIKQLRMLCRRENPDIRALNALAMVLDKTGKLNYNMEDEKKWQQKLDKMSPSQLCKAALRPSILPQQQEDEDSLYL